MTSHCTRSQILHCPVPDQSHNSPPVSSWVAVWLETHTQTDRQTGRQQSRKTATSWKDYIHVYTLVCKHPHTRETTPTCDNLHSTSLAKDGRGMRSLTWCITVYEERQLFPLLHIWQFMTWCVNICNMKDTSTHTCHGSIWRGSSNIHSTS